MNAFTIKDLENLSGIRAHTIRIWEQRYSFLKPSRTETNIRYYNGDELRTILNIALLNKFGFKISHIGKMDEGEIHQKILSLSQAQAQQDRLINDLIQSMVQTDIDRFELLLDNYISYKGIEKTITQIIFPFLERIGILWVTNNINPAQEHLVSNVIRQKLIMGIATTNPLVRLNKEVLLFLPEGEHHELALLFLHYLLKSRGAKVWYLGANIPIKDVAFVVENKKPDYVYTHLTSLPNSVSAEKLFETLCAQLANTPIIASGQMVQQYKKKIPQQITLKKTLAEVIEHVANL